MTVSGLLFSLRVNVGVQESESEGDDGAASNGNARGERRSPAALY